MIEITSIINTLPEGKLPCIDGVTYEHIKHVGEIIVELLLKLLCHRLIELEEIPNPSKWRLRSLSWSSKRTGCSNNVFYN